MNTFESSTRLVTDSSNNLTGDGYGCEIVFLCTERSTVGISNVTRQGLFVLALSEFHLTFKSRVWTSTLVLVVALL
jgi:hypothetical protein